MSRKIIPSHHTLKIKRNYYDINYKYKKMYSAMRQRISFF